MFVSIIFLATSGATSKMRVTVNGAGIGGLVTALALHSKHLIPNLHINILERNPDSNPFVGRGAGLNLQPHALKVLDDVGLMEEVVANGWAPMNQQYFTKNGRLIANSPRGVNALYSDPNAYPQISIHRAALYGILERAVKERLGPDAITRGLQGVAYSQNEDEVCLKCKDASGTFVEIRSDVVIGADGIHSGVRQAMLQVQGKQESGPIKSGINIYRGTAFVDKVLDGHTVVLAGHSMGKLVCYPLEAPILVSNLDGSVGQKQLLNFVVEIYEDSSPSSATKKEDLAEHVANKLEELNCGFRLPFLDHRSLLRKADSLKAFPMSDRNPLDTWCDGRVFLMGDAAHPMYPVGSNGASSALLDAAEIASALASINLKKKTHISHDDAEIASALADIDIKKKAHISHTAICQALKDFEKVRLPVANSVQLTCREMLPEKVMDRVHCEVRCEGPISSRYEVSLLEALAKCQAGTNSKSISGKDPCVLPTESNDGIGSTLRTQGVFLNRKLVANFSPMERALLAADGSLQRLMSAISNADVVVQPLMTCSRNKHFLDRAVQLLIEPSVGGPRHVAATCITTVIPHDENIKERMLSQEIGIGQLLTERRKDGKEEPFFRLIAAGRKQDGILTRQYVLDIPGEITFLIHEELHLDVVFGKFGIVTSRQVETSWGAGLDFIDLIKKEERRMTKREKVNKFARSFLLFHHKGPK